MKAQGTLPLQLHCLLVLLCSLWMDPSIIFCRLWGQTGAVPLGFCWEGLSDLGVLLCGCCYHKADTAVKKEIAGLPRLG